MRPIRKAILTLLAMMPVTSISTVAHCQLNAMAGEEQNDLLKDNISNSHKMLMAPGTNSISIEDSMNYFAQKSGITDPQTLDQEFAKHVKVLLDKGLIEKTEMNIRSQVPSIW